LRPFRLLLLAALVAGAVVALPTGPAASGDDIEAVRARALEATQALADAESRMGLLDQQINDAQYQTEQAQAEIAGLQDQVEELIVQQYMRPHDTLVFGDDLVRITRAQAMARIVTHGDVDALDRYQGATEDLRASSARLAELQADQQDAIAELQERQDDLEAEIARLEELERQRREAEERRRREAAEAAAAAAAAADEPPPTVPADDGDGGGGTTPPPSGGGITCPVPGSSFVDTWGAPRSGGRSHEGVDMMASSGTHIFAPASGNVEFRTVSTGGLSFYVYGDNGDTYFGTHLSGYEGANRHVSAGEFIGYVGDSGNAAGTPHLHFEIHPGGGGPVNPYPATAAACF
jgi:murein DD-endopeptidase MepM/ murein hydrolase activator NlpD